MFLPPCQRRFSRFCVFLMLALPIRVFDSTCRRVSPKHHWHAFERFRSLKCFTGYYFIDDERSHNARRSSCAAVYIPFPFVFAIFAPPASCRFFIDVGRSGASLATISLTTSAPMQRGARPARPFTHFSNSFLLFLLRLPHAVFSSTSVALVLHWLLFH